VVKQGNAVTTQEEKEVQWSKEIAGGGKTGILQKKERE